MDTLLLWDIDGTLLHNKGVGSRAMNRTFLQMFGEENAFAGIKLAGGLDLHFVGIVFEKYGIDPAQMEAFFEAYLGVLAEEVRKPGFAVLPGVREILTRTEQEAHLFNALGTGNIEQGARIKLDVFDLNRYFPVGGFCEAPVERFEMLQAGVANASHHYGIPFAPEQVIVIGDTVRDIEAARKIGARVIAVATGGNSMEELAEWKPDLLLEDLQNHEPFWAFLEKSHR